MGTRELLLFLFLFHFIAAKAVRKRQDVMFFHDVPGFFDNIRPFPFERNFDFTPFDTFFSSWPDFHMLEALAPVMVVPRIEVFCDESKLTLLVDKRANGVVLTGEEVQLGDGCHSNRELPNQFVFTYRLDECGTTPVMQNGLVMFTNSLYLSLKNTASTRWTSPSTVHISCIPKRLHPNYFDSTVFPKNDKNFNMKAMNPSWTSTAQSNVYKRGEVVNLQVSAKSRPELQLFIQSCFVSASPESQTRPRHAVIMNKGCTAPLGSPHPVVQFLASDRLDVVNFVLNTSYLITELYVHCSVLLSDQGVNFASKSCNYDLIQSRWEDISGNVEVCECCSSKCRGLSLKQLPGDAKAIVSAGPFVIVDKTVAISPEPSLPEPPTSTLPAPDPMLSDNAATEDAIVSGTSVSRPPQGVVVVSQDPAARLTLWLPGQVRDAEQDNVLRLNGALSNDLPELRPSTTDQQPRLYTPTFNKLSGQSANEVGSDDQTWDLNLLTLVDGWEIPPRTEEEAFAEESQRKRRFERSRISSETLPEEDVSPTQTNTNQDDFNQMGDEPADVAVMPQDDANDAQPIIRSKLEFSKGTDGSQMLSYEEEVMQQGGEAVIRRCDTKSKESRQRGLRSVFLDMLRRMDKAE